MATERISKSERTKQLLDVALTLAEREGWSNLTRDGIATLAGCHNATVSFTLGTMTELKRSVMRHAVMRRSLAVVAEGLSRGDKTARKAPQDLKDEVAAWLAER